MAVVTTPLRITVWNEFRHEHDAKHPAHTIYPEGIHGAIAAGLREHAGFEVCTATLDEPEHGLTEAVLAETDVDLVGPYGPRRVTTRWSSACRRVLDGMGLIVLHSGHFEDLQAPDGQLPATWKWREADDNERPGCSEPGHPIAAGLGETIELEEEEMYGERFDIPAPETLVFMSWFSGGEVFRSGCCYTRGRGKISTSAPATRATRPTSTRYPAGDRQRRALGQLAGGPKPLFGNAKPIQKR